MAAEAGLSRALRGPLGRVLRVAFAVLPLWWLGRRVDVAGVLRHAAAIGTLPIAAALALWFANYLLGTWRWAVLMRAYGADRLPPFRHMLKDLLIAGYFNMLPSGLAGDVVRAVRIAPFAPDLGAALTVIATERIVGLVALVGIAAGTAMRGSELAAGPSGVAFRVACGAAAALSAALLVLPWWVARSPGARAFVTRLPLGERLLLRVAPARRPGGVAGALALSFATQAVAILIAEVLLFRLADRAALVAAIGTLPFAILLAYVPITPGGVLQREAVYVMFLGLAGISADRAVAVAALSFALLLVLAGIGGLLYGAERLGWIRAENAVNAAAAAGSPGRAP
jgi:uncharacterized membrane protein YbhN (UPF0104 family)